MAGIKQVSWQVFKQFVDNKDLSIQFIEYNSEYSLNAIDGAFAMECVLDKTPTDPTELDDFETNYKPNGNKPTRSHFVHALGPDAHTISPVGMLFTATKGQTTSHDKQLTEAYALKGGVMLTKDSEWGDSIKVQVIDKDDILGMGATPEAPIVLKEYVPEWYVMPGKINELVDTSIGTLPAPGLYFRLIYTSVPAATVDVTGVVNVFAYLAS